MANYVSKEKEKEKKQTSAEIRKKYSERRGNKSNVKKKDVMAQRTEWEEGKTRDKAARGDEKEKKILD